MVEIDCSRRIAFLSILAWVSICLLMAGWAPIENSMVRALSCAGLFGLLSAVGLSESLQQRTKKMLESLSASCTTDSLTGVGNRRLLDGEIERRIAQRRRQGTTVSMLMIDVDHFKQINDTYGHQAGDFVLRELATHLEATLRDMDLLTRYGGEEFVAVLPGTALPQAKLAAERIRKAVEQCVIPVRDTKLKATVSIGVTEAHNHDTTETLFARADRALYAAKRAGRNCSFVCATIDCVPVAVALDPPSASMVEQKLSGCH
jgi:diguanylate cyclase (GGDEF)-like protein